VYLPTTFNPERTWPVLFIMSPVGGGAWTLERYRRGAEACQWITAVSVESRNYFIYSSEAVEAMIEDLCARLPVDTHRVYYSGFSGGARMALRMAEERAPLPCAGVIACGAGRYPNTIGSDVTVYGLCGCTCFNRRDMALTFTSLRSPGCRLEFFVGDHEWAGPALLEEAMVWLNAWFLREAAPRNRRYRAEWQATARGLTRAAFGCATNQPLNAYKLATLAAGPPVTLPVQRTARALAVKLNRLSSVRRNLAAEAALASFVDEYLAARDAGRTGVSGSNQLARAAQAYAEAHKRTPQARLFRELARPAPIPDGLLQRAVDAARQRGLTR
jgi:hypothetical protein